VARPTKPAPNQAAFAGIDLNFAPVTLISPRGPITVDEADAIFRSSPYFDRLDDHGPADDPAGFVYYLDDGTSVLIDHDGRMTYEAA
jgi:hypothetical protein